MKIRKICTLLVLTIGLFIIQACAQAIQPTNTTPSATAKVTATVGFTATLAADDGSRFPVRGKDTAAGAQFGYINRFGEMMIPLRTLISAQRFSEGIAIIQVGKNAFQYIDNHGNLISPDSYTRADPFSEGLAYVRHDDDTVGIHNWGFIDKQGKFVIGPMDGKPDPENKNRTPDPLIGEMEGNFFHDGLWVQNSAEQVTFIWDKNNKQIFSAVHANRFSEGLAPVCYAGNTPDICAMWAVIDKSGKEKFKLGDFPVSRYHYFSEGMLVVSNKLFGFVNSAGQLAIPMKYESALNFSGGLAAVQSPDNHLWGFINQRGKITIPYKYDKVAPYSDGMAAIYFRDPQTGDYLTGGYMDRRGDVSITKWFGDSFQDGLAYVHSNYNKNISGYIDTRGNIIYQEQK